MNRGSRSAGREKAARELIGEMMLAKSVLEEKSELLDQKDNSIRELRAQVRGLVSELEEVRAELERSTLELETRHEKARQEGVACVVQQVACLAADYDIPQAQEGLAARLIKMLCERHGLEVVDTASGKIDPQVHEVIEADHDHQGSYTIEVLRKGFRLKGKVLRPALVRVLQGQRHADASAATQAHSRPIPSGAVSRKEGRCGFNKAE